MVGCLIIPLLRYTGSFRDPGGMSVGSRTETHTDTDTHRRSRIAGCREWLADSGKVPGVTRTLCRPLRGLCEG